jgi:hypothetical protein
MSGFRPNTEISGGLKKIIIKAVSIPLKLKFIVLFGNQIKKSRKNKR